MNSTTKKMSAHVTRLEVGLTHPLDLPHARAVSTRMKEEADKATRQNAHEYRALNSEGEGSPLSVQKQQEEQKQEGDLRERYRRFGRIAEMQREELAWLATHLLAIDEWSMDNVAVSSARLHVLRLLASTLEVENDGRLGYMGSYEAVASNDAADVDAAAEE